MDKSSTSRTGACLCGAVRFSAANVPGDALVCHCRSCQRWTGSAYVEVSVAENDVIWEGQDSIRVHTSSDWGERAFCGTCGSHLYFRVTDGGPYAGTYALPLGLFDDTSGFALKAEIFVDKKPDTYALTDTGQTQLTRAQCVAQFSKLGSDGSA